MAINSVTLVGRAGRDPEVRYFESGTVVANLTMAVNRRNRNDEPDWFNLEIWGKQAQIAADYVKKGSLIGITGSFKMDSWKDRNTGEDRNKPVVRVDRLELLGSKRDSENSNFQNNNLLPHLHDFEWKANGVFYEIVLVAIENILKYFSDTLLSRTPALEFEKKKNKIKII